MKRLILGGVKSGKSRYAEALVKSWLRKNGRAENAVVYLATSRVFEGDEELPKRIAAHKAQRPSGWTTVEEPIDISGIIEASSGMDKCILLECLTLWISNLLHDDHEIGPAVNRLCTVLQAYEGEIVMVSNETGLGIMPINALARRFGDEAGMLHQRLAVISDEVVLTVAGLAQVLKTIHPNNRQ